jgi:4-hydroxythreonine-4-phosphate dehydrogenase
MTKPLIAITMGDAAGIGAEVILRALAEPEIYNLCRPCVIGDAAHLRRVAAMVALPQKIFVIDDPAQANSNVDTVCCLDLGLIPPNLPFGVVDAVAGECAYQAIVVAVRLALTGKVDALCTAPINKAALHAAGHKFPGHTELLAALTDTPEVSLMMVTPGLRVIHVTMHLGLLDAIARIEPDLVLRTITRGYHAMRRAGIAAPRIAVCGINPHAGENGLFGNGEEAAKIIPAITRAQAQGWDVSGPHPADTVFYRMRRGDFDLIVAMYHDQGLAPVKVLGIDDAVNVTVGLPIIRTSVGHGTAFDIADKGLADPHGMCAALRQAALLTQGKS